MRLTKWGHACVSLAAPGVTIVIDPGALTEPAALEGADAVLVTHEHPDHFVEEHLRAAADANPALRIWTNPSVAARLDGLGSQVTAVGHGDTFTVDGLDIEVWGRLHMDVHPDLPAVVNIGFFVGGTLFHPGDAFTVPDRPVDTLLLPVHGLWSRTGQVIDYLREIAPRRALTIHDAQLSEAGNAIVDGVVSATAGGADYVRIAAGTHTELALTPSPAGVNR